MLGKLARVGAIVLTTAAAALAPVPASADSGGGCRNYGAFSNPYVCISVRSGTTNPLIGDFYLNSTPSGERTANIQIVAWCGNSATFTNPYWWTIVPNHSPQIAMNKPCASGYAYTRAAFYNANNAHMYTATSLTQYW
ncbi:hypothetical protein [Micromonospora sp. NBC_01638]|uniref:hypothetical protein n=1 Tax=Micromonospora sp. NBC_01638 TaxID=2975982 RepID=UPI00386341E9|nr:hypothetical protein OG811_29660 [Micromonospora sp. NBC_01638]